MLSKLHTEVGANELFHLSKCLKTFQYHYETFLNKSKENNTHMAFKKEVVLKHYLSKKPNVLLKSG